MDNSPLPAAPAAAFPPAAQRAYVRHVSDLRRGQLIGIGHSFSIWKDGPKVFSHFGIFLGQNQQEHGMDEEAAVVHYSSTYSQTGVRGTVCVSPLSDFFRETGTLTDVFIELGPSMFPPDEVVGRALSRLGERDWWLLSNNFAHWAYWDVEFSAQADRILRLHPAFPGLNARAHNEYVRVKNELRRARHLMRYL